MASKTIKGLTVEIGGDTTKLGKALDDVENKSRDLSAELGQINKLLKLDPGNTDLLAQKQKVLTEAVATTTDKLKTLKEAEKQVQKQFERGEVSEAQVRALKREIIDTESKLEHYQEEAKKAAKATKGFGDEAKEIDLTGFGESLVTGIKAIGAAVGAAVGALVASAEASREYRTEMGKLDTAFTTAGHSSEAAKATYQELQGVLGDTGQAVEAANHLAKLTSNEQELQKWTNICTGVYATFGASLPIEGLAEAANETAKVGQVTGPLADALNWAGVSEDAFNESLAKCTTEQERQTLIMETLNGLYDEAATKYKETNAEVIRANEANEAWMASTGEVGAAIEPVISDVKLLGASLLSELVPGVNEVTDAFHRLLNGEDGAAADIGSALSDLISHVVNKVVEMLPSLIDMAVSLVTTLTQSLVATIAAEAPAILNAVVDGIFTLVKVVGEMLPEFITLAVDLVILLAETLIDNIDLIIDAAMAIIMGLADGLVTALPRLIDKIPVIIDKLCSAITTNLPKLISMGIELTLKLAVGIIKAIPQLVAQIPQVIASILKAFTQLPKMMVTVGSDLVKGLWNGISDMVGWIGKKIKGFGESVLTGIKNFFGIKSPSRVFKNEIGKQLAIGLAEGIEDNAKQPLAAMTSLSNDLLGEAEAMDGLTFERRLQHTFANPDTVASAESGMLAKLDKIYQAIVKGQVIMLDSKVLVGSTAYQYDGELGQRRILAERGAL